MHPHLLLALALILGLVTLAHADDPPKDNDAKPPADLRAFIEKAVAPLIKEQPGIGVVVGISTADGPEAGQVFGFGHVTLDGKEVTPDGNTLFQVASVTKAFTGTLLAELVNAGACRLDDPAQKYLPAELQLPRRDDRDITLLNLATHTSSLPVQPPGLPLFAVSHDSGPTNPYKHYMPADLAKTLKGIQLKTPIGSEQTYSNLGVGILGIALAGAAKAPSFEAALTDRILKPLGMTQSKVTLTEEDRAKRLAPGHNEAGDRASTWDFGCLEACGGLQSTVNDMLRFGRAALADVDKQPLKDSFRLAQQPWRELKGGRKTYVGLAWVRSLSANNQNTLIWHNGQVGGYRAFIGVIPERKIVFVLLANVARNADPVAMSIIGRLEQGEK